MEVSQKLRGKNGSPDASHSACQVPEMACEVSTSSL